MLKQVVMGVMALGLLISCGGGDTPPPSGPTVIYDEAVDGPLPYTVSGLSDAQALAYTFTLYEGEYVVQGGSTSGEEFIIEIPVGFELEGLYITFYSSMNNNGHGVTISGYSTGSAVYSNFEPLPTIGTYEYALSISSGTVGPGIYRFSQRTAVSGTPSENPYSIRLEMRRTL